MFLRDIYKKGLSIENADNEKSNLFKKSSKFSIKDWIEIKDDSSGVQSTGSQSRFKAMMLKSSLCVHSDAYIFVSGRARIIE